MGGPSKRRQDAKPLGKRQVDKAATREKILASARSEFARRGYHGTSIRDLCASAGVSTGAFYGNFDNKREIFETITDEIYLTMKSILNEATEKLIADLKNSTSGKLTSNIVHDLIEIIFREAIKHVDLFDILRREGLGRDPDFYKQFNRVWESFVRATERTLKAYIEAGLVKPYDTDLVARAVVPMAITMMLYAKRSKPDRFDDIVDTVAAMVDGGIMRLTSGN